MILDGPGWTRHADDAGDGGPGAAAGRGVAA